MAGEGRGGSRCRAVIASAQHDITTDGCRARAEAERLGKAERSAAAIVDQAEGLRVSELGWVGLAGASVPHRDGFPEVEDVDREAAGDAIETQKFCGGVGGIAGLEAEGIRGGGVAARGEEEEEGGRWGEVDGLRS